MVDETNARLYVLGASGAGTVQYKSVLLGQEADLRQQTASTLFEAAGHSLASVGTPRNGVESVAQILFLAGDETGGSLWHGFLPISGGGSAPPPANKPSITGFSPDSGMVGTEVTITGTNFSGATQVRFNNTIAVTYFVDSDSVIRATVPNSATTGKITVVTPNGSATSASDFTVIQPAPVLASFTPSTGNTDTEVRISGQHFSDATEVTFNGTPAVTYSVDADTLIRANVPPGATTGFISVTTPWGTATSADTFTVTQIPIIASFTPTSGTPGTQVTLIGHNFTGATSVMFNGTPVTVYTVDADTMITATLPDSATTGLISVTTAFGTGYSGSNFTVTPQGALGTSIAGTMDGSEKPNQSKVFYYDGTWWIAARSRADSDWYLWKYENNTWVQDAFIHGSSSARPDCFIEPDSAKLYVFVAHKSKTRFNRYSYVNGSWQMDSGYPVSLDFNTNNDDPASFCRAQDGTLWAFRINRGNLEAVYSIDEGQSWSAPVVLKNSLNASSGVTSAVRFAAAGQTYVGVAYGENTTSSSTFGFLYHQDGAAPLLWTDESDSLTAFIDEKGDDHIAIAASDSGEVFIIGKTGGGGQDAPANPLYKRNPDGAWERFVVNYYADEQWTRPSLVIDRSTDRLYLFGTLQRGVGKYKVCQIGQEGTLAMQTGEILYQNNLDEFWNLNTPKHSVEQSWGLMTIADNLIDGTVWYNHLDITGAVAKRGLVQADAGEAVRTFALLGNFPNPFNIQTKIAFSVAGNGHSAHQCVRHPGPARETVARR
ncbi:MAG: IPT/TIG domain-containing protein [candidate division KSB1 bacterium]|nr:IPT/TIG domain-containing protein [candidate division KSB1 bacterium]